MYVFYLQTVTSRCAAVWQAGALDTCCGCCCCSCQETTLQGLSGEASDPQAAAARQQGCAVLRDVLSRAFAEADPQVCTSKRHGVSLLLRPDTEAVLSLSHASHSTAEDSLRLCTQ